MAETLTCVRRDPGRGARRHRSWTVTLTGERRDACIARTHARRALGSIEPAAADDVLVVVSELVTNAILHGRDPIVLTLTVEPSEVVISVSDKGLAEPSRHHPAADEEYGRGLQIIQRLATRWYVEHADGRKSVIAVVRTAADDDEPQER